MNYVLILIVQSVWFSLPMYVSNMVPILAKKIDFLDVPIDGGRTWKGKRIFGSHKTYRGFVFGVGMAVAVAYLQKMLFLQGGVWGSVSIFNYAETSSVLFGFLLGFGALLGDAVESFFKRQIGIAPGRSWFVFDQIDYVIGGLVLVSILYVPPLPHVITILFIGVFGSFVSSYLGYHAGLKESKV